MSGVQRDMQSYHTSTRWRDCLFIYWPGYIRGRLDHRISLMHHVTENSVSLSMRLKKPSIRSYCAEFKPDKSPYHCLAQQLHLRKNFSNTASSKYSASPLATITHNKLKKPRHESNRVSRSRSPAVEALVVAGQQHTRRCC